MNADEPKSAVTLDTNVPQELWRGQDKEGVVQGLLSRFLKGEIDLAVTTRIRCDTPLPPLADQIDQLLESGIKMIGAPFTWDLSGWDSGDFWVSEEEQEAEVRIRDILAERTMRTPEDADFDHILGHHAAGRDVFLTWDEAILRAADIFFDHLGVRIISPEDFVGNTDEWLGPERRYGK